jgi:alpha-1,6-mannosyltransferase
MIITTVALSYWISLLRETEKKEEKRRGAMMTLILLTTATVVFRCDVILLLACTSLHLLLTRHITIPQIILTCTATAVVCLVITVPVDSFFWDKWLWPEGQVLWFNTVMNKSREWGVMPWQWYLVSALPRALTISYILAPFGALFLDTGVRPAFVVALGYVLLYSNLGHKEVRFLFPVLPLFTLCAAAALQALIHRSFCSSTQKKKQKKKKPMSRWLFRLMFLVSIGGIAAGSVITVIGTIASKYNYPGGVAFLSLHTIVKGGGGGGRGNRGNNNNIVKVHINVLPAMTGVTRFGEQQHSNGWYYSKKDSTSDSSSELLESGFDYLLSGDRRVEGYEVVEVVDGFDRVQVERGGGGKLWWWPVVKVVTKPSVYIHKRKRLEGE